MMGTNAKVRRWIFLFFSAGLYIASLGNWESAVAVSLFIVLPYIYLNILQKWDVPVWPAGIMQIGVFIYINKYVWILDIIGAGIPNYIKLAGISYILFRQWDILQQVKARLVDKVPVVDYLNYLFSFWTIMAGPIQRYKEFIQAFYGEKIPLSNKESLECFHRAANGMLKILVIAAFFKYLSDAAYGHSLTEGVSIFYMVSMFYGYPLYVYFNFSGYCDVVIAMGRWAGFKIPENFNKPYLSRDMIEMWNRWHITLSQLVRDYLFQPLLKILISGPLSGYARMSQYISIFITFFLVGIWHGTTINFVVFGLLQGLGMAVSMIYRDQGIRQLGKIKYKMHYDNKWVANIERFFCLNFWCFTFLFFEYDVFKMNGWLFQLLGGAYG